MLLGDIAEGLGLQSADQLEILSVQTGSVVVTFRYSSADEAEAASALQRAEALGAWFAEFRRAEYGERKQHSPPPTPHPHRPPVKRLYL